MDNYKEKILALLQSKDASAWALAIELESSMGIDLQAFWHNLHLLTKRSDNDARPKEKMLEYMNLPNWNKGSFPIQIKDLLALNPKEPMPILQGIRALRLAVNVFSTQIPENEQNPDSYEVFRLFPNVDYLRLHGISVFPMGLEHLPKIEEIALFFTNKITKIHEGVGKLKQLKVLRLLSNKVEELPENIGDAKELRQILLMNCAIRRLPDSICNLEKLEMLDLAGNNIQTLPEGITKLKKLTWIRLNDNPSLDWRQVSNLLLQMPNLTTIYIFKRFKLQKEKDENGELYFSIMVCDRNSYKNGERYTQEFYKIFFNIITNIPKLRRLTIHDVYYFKYIPDNIELCSDLQELTLRHCLLTTLPDAIFNMHKLRKLDISFNRITLLPESILKLQQLEYLSIANNQIRLLPEELGNLPKLKFVNTTNCWLQQSPVSMRRVQEWKGRIKQK